MQRLVKFVGNVCFYVILITVLLIGFQSVMNKKNGGVTDYFGYRVFNVLTGSMSPTINAGALIIDKVVEPDQVQVGDVITFKGANSSLVTTHRVVEVLQKNSIEFVTKGDANAVIDPLKVSSEQLLGRVQWSIPWLGAMVEWGQTHFLEIGVVLVAVFGIFYTIQRLLKGNSSSIKS